MMRWGLISKLAIGLLLIGASPSDSDLTTAAYAQLYWPQETEIQSHTFWIASPFPWTRTALESLQIYYHSSRVELLVGQRVICTVTEPTPREPTRKGLQSDNSTERAEGERGKGCGSTPMTPEIVGCCDDVGVRVTPLEPGQFGPLLVMVALSHNEAFCERPPRPCGAPIT